MATKAQTESASAKKAKASTKSGDRPATQRTMDRVRRAQAERSPRAKTMDSKVNCKVVFGSHPTEAEARAWLARPGRYDILGIDTMQDDPDRQEAVKVPGESTTGDGKAASGGEAKATPNDSLPQTYAEYELWRSKRNREKHDSRVIRPRYTVCIDYADPQANYRLCEGDEPIWVSWENGTFDSFESAMDELDTLVAETADNPDYGAARITNSHYQTIWDETGGLNADILSTEELDVIVPYLEKRAKSKRKIKRRKAQKYSRREYDGRDYSESHYQNLRRRYEGDPVGFAHALVEAEMMAYEEPDSCELDYLNDCGYDDYETNGRWKWNSRDRHREYKKKRAEEYEMWRLNDEQAYAYRSYDVRPRRRVRRSGRRA